MTFPPEPARPDELADILRRLASPREPLPTDAVPRLTRLPAVRAVLFDIYGTLLVSGSGDIGVSAATDSADALDAALAATGLATDQPAGPAAVDAFRQAIRDEHDRLRARGNDTPEVDIRDIWRNVLADLAAEGLARPTDRQDRLEALAVQYEARVNPTWPMPGLADTLAVLQQRFPLGIVSNAQCFTPLLFDALADASLDELGFDPELRAYSYRHLAAKPGLEMFRTVLDELHRRGIASAETVYVGNDMLNDVFTADRAGLKTVLFAGDRRSLRLRSDEPRCQDLQPSAVVTELTQLPELL